MKEKNPLLSQEQRRVRRGEVVIHTNRYWSAKLIAVDGADVLVVYDITDARKVDIYDLSGKFYCHAYPSRAQEDRISRAANATRADHPVHESDCKENAPPHDLASDRVNMQALEALHRDYLQRIECAAPASASDFQADLSVD